MLGLVVLASLIGSGEETSTKTSPNGVAEAVLTDAKQLLNGG